MASLTSLEMHARAVSHSLRKAVSKLAGDHQDISNYAIAADIIDKLIVVNDQYRDIADVVVALFTSRRKGSAPIGGDPYMASVKLSRYDPHQGAIFAKILTDNHLMEGPRNDRHDASGNDEHTDDADSEWTRQSV